MVDCNNIHLKSLFQTEYTPKAVVRLVNLSNCLLPSKMKERIPDMNLSGMLFNPFSSGHCVLHFIDCDYPFDIFKLFLDVNVSSYTKCKIKINKHLILIKIVFFVTLVKQSITYISTLQMLAPTTFPFQLRPTF